MNIRNQQLQIYSQTRRWALGGLLVLLIPSFFPTLLTPLGRAYPSLFSEWNAPKPMHFQLLNGALQRQTSDERESEIWSPLPNQGWKPCVDSHISLGLPEKSQGYIQVFLDGGLNQQRMGVCDAVAVAKILNATLVIPHFEVNPVWQDSSSFTDIFDVDHFIDTLKNEVSIVKDLQSPYSWSTREYYGTGIRATRIKTAPLHASASWYLENVLPIMKSYGIAAIAPFSHRLVFDNLPSEIQHLQCKVNFEALVFVPYIRMLAEAIINRLRFGPSVRGVSDVSNGQERVGDKLRAGKYVALHLRFDKDRAAHSACDFGGGKAEKLALAKYHQVLWQGRVLNSHFTDKEEVSVGIDQIDGLQINPYRGASESISKNMDMNGDSKKERRPVSSGTEKQVMVDHVLSKADEKTLDTVFLEPKLNKAATNISNSAAKGEIDQEKRLSMRAETRNVILEPNLPREEVSAGNEVPGGVGFDSFYFVKHGLLWELIETANGKVKGVHRNWAELVTTFKGGTSWSQNFWIIMTHLVLIDCLNKKVERFRRISPQEMQYISNNHLGFGYGEKICNCELVLATLVMNKFRGVLKIASLKSTGFEKCKSQYLDDIAVLTGGTISREKVGLSLDKVRSEVLERAAKVVLIKETTIMGCWNNISTQNLLGNILISCDCNSKIFSITQE